MNGESCGECGKPLGRHGDLTHAGLCRDCALSLLARQDSDVIRLLDSLPQPAALVGRDHTLLFANRLIRERFDLGGDPAGVRIGEVIACRYAATHGRCGDTVACPHCTLQRLTALARICGEGLHTIPAAFRHASGAERTLVFTVEKAGDAVLLTL